MIAWVNMRRRPEPTQPRNPHELTLQQHVHSRWCISRFADGSGCVSVLRRAQPVPFPKKPEDEIFCAKRVWDQQTEAGFFKKIEDAFHREVSESLRLGTISDHAAVTEYLAVWEVRSRLSEDPPNDVELAGPGEPPLSKDQEEVIERKWGKFQRGTSLPGRFFAHARAIRLVDEIMSVYGGIRWGLARVRSVPGLICPDRPASQAYIPIDRKHALVAEWQDRRIGPDDVARWNRDSWSQSRDLVFGHPDDVIAFSRTL